MWRFTPVAGTISATFPFLEEVRHGVDSGGRGQAFRKQLQRFFPSASGGVHDKSIQQGSTPMTSPGATAAAAAAASALGAQSSYTPATGSSDSTAAFPTRTLSAIHVLGRTRCGKCGGVYCKSFFPAEFAQKYKLVDADEYVAKLGEGGFGSVVRCIHRGTGVHKAAKFFDSTEAQGLRAWKKCGHHPNIVELVDHFSSGDSRSEVAVMDLCHGIDICDHLAEVESMTEADAGQIFRHMVRALTHVHGCGVLHRDLKLENFIFAHSSLDDENNDQVSIRLGDFGLARLMDEEDETEIIQGTPLYMPPEVLDGRRFTAAGDVYALGVCLFILLTRHFPYCNTIPRGPPQMDLLKKCSPQARDLVSGMLEPDPAKRLRLHDVASHPFCTRSKSLKKFASGLCTASQKEQKRSQSLSKIKQLAAAKGEKGDLEVRKMDDGEVLFKEGEDGNDVYLVNEGSVEIWKGGKFIATLEEGDIIGEMALLYSNTRSATVKAGREGAQLYVVHGSDAREMWKNKKSLTTMRSLAEISTHRDAFNTTLHFFQEIYPNIQTFVVHLVESLCNNESDPSVHRIQEGEAVTDMSLGTASGRDKIYCVRTGELSVFDNDVLLFKVPPGSFIAKPAVFKRIDASELIPGSFSAGSKLTIVAQEETEVMDLTIPMMQRLKQRNPVEYGEFLKQAIGLWKKA